MRKMTFATLLFLISLTVVAQKKQYSSLQEAIYASGMLRGESGPSAIQWIENGDRYAFTKREGRSQQIWTYDMKDQTEELVFNGGDHTFPGGEVPFSLSFFPVDQGLQLPPLPNQF